MTRALCELCKPNFLLSNVITTNKACFKPGFLTIYFIIIVISCSRNNITYIFISIIKKISFNYLTA